MIYMLTAVEETRARGNRDGARDQRRTARRASTASATHYKFYSQDLINNTLLAPLHEDPVRRSEELDVSRLTATKYLDALAGGGFLQKHEGRSHRTTTSTARCTAILTGARRKCRRQPRRNDAQATVQDHREAVPKIRRDAQARRSEAQEHSRRPSIRACCRRRRRAPIRVAYERRNRDLDPQLVWRGKDEQDWSDLVVHAPPLYIQEKVHPKALIDDLLRQTRESKHESGEIDADLFADFNGIPKGVDKTEFYQHDQNWSNRMILGDSLQVMAWLAEREGLRGKVQCIYFDPPYGIKFNSNFQWSTTSRDVKDGNAAHITREPEQVKAFRDTWRDGIH